MPIFKQGRYKPKNPQKYKGDPTKIVYRSSWELKFAKWADNHPKVISWSSEELAIPYISPIDNKHHRYFPDFLLTIEKTDGSKETILVEIKPKNQTIPPKKVKKTAKFINEVMTWGVNQAKWKAANSYCQNRGWKFMLFTEKELGIK